MNNYKVNSQKYWEKRFESDDWKINRGQEQTHYFYTILTRLLPQWIIHDIKSNNLKVYDFGCAEGQGMPLLQEKLGSNIIGIDFSSSAIENAKNNYPQYNFEIGDITAFKKDIDVAILSNIIEHFFNPYEIVKKLSQNISKYLIILVPFEEKDLMAEHEHDFTYNNIPILINEFQLVYFEEYDCLQDQNGLFLGKQILLIYSRESLINETLNIKELAGPLKNYENAISQIQTTRSENENLSRQIETIHQNNNNLLLQLESAKKNIESLVVQKSALNRKNNELLDNINDVLSKQNDFVKKFQNISDENVVLRDQLQNTTHLNCLLQSDLQNNIDKYSKCSTEYSGLLEMHENLKATYEQLSLNYNNLINSYTWKIANIEFQIAKKLHLLGIVDKCIKIRKNGIRTCTKDKTRSNCINLDKTVSELDEMTSDTSSRDQISTYISAQNKIFEDILISPLSDTSLQLKNILHSRKYRGIIVYPHAVKWEPIQRPQHFLRELANKGYICFFCENADYDENVKEVYPNLFVVKNGEISLLPILQDQYVILLITYFLQTLFAKHIPQKVIWFDVLDRLDFFAGSGQISDRIYKSLVKDADIVSYSADALREYVASRTDALKLPNGVNLNDFNVKDELIPSDLEPILKTGHKIVGYYGAIESWFDTESVLYLANHTSYEIVLIGNANIDISNKLNHERIHLLGRKDYKDLISYAKYFDVAIIPFIVNNLTNAVSPVKFFEFAALGIPTVSSEINEMIQYSCPLVQLYNSCEDMVEKIDLLCTHNSAKELLKKIAFENTWSKRVDYVLDKLLDVRYLPTLANINNSGCLALETVTFFKFDGSTYYSGGAERYLIDLDEICRELNLKLRVYQYAEYDWIRFYNNLEVIGLGAKENDPNLYTIELKNEMNGLFRRNTWNQTVLNIYSAFHLLQEKNTATTIGISHGVFWDAETNHYINGIDFWNANSEIIRAAQICDYMVSVDTNTCNWFQTVDYNLSRKIKYIPNYVDTSEFAPSEKGDTDRIVITYPRRLYAARGLYIVLDILDDILKIFPNTEFHFVGKGFPEDTKYVQQKISQWGDRVKWYSKAPDQMHEVYKESDISLVPTMYSEGTSLSCLEALSSGNIVICTRVGGLTDLIIDGFNGLLIEPDSESLKNALMSILSDAYKMQMLKKNAIATAQAFSKDIWKGKWKDILQRALRDTPTSPYTKCKRCLISLNHEDLLNKKVLKCICQYLSEGYYVFVSSNKKEYRSYSYKRIQFISQNEDLYFQPDIVIDENSLLD